MSICSNCGAENPPEHKYCGNCGTALASVCSNCGAANEPGNRFCGNCGTALDSPEEHSHTTGGSDDARSAAERRTERRFVSVLFADLVSFTSFSEHRDSEDVRTMLTDYFDRSRDIIELYGGQIDKFIGDAVMGVWGAVEAHEDDAERATRAAMDLVAMVADLGAEIDVPELAARAGVLSGETAVGPGGNEKGLVVGDLVNTASRLQSIAHPGGVLVGAPTRDLIAASIETKPAGEHVVKGKDIPVAAFEALRVISDPSKIDSTDLIEGPFVGRDDEMRILKDQLHAAGREGRARLVSIVGEGGIGKTRLSQELLRWIDGIAEDIYYHHGRSPSYGDGVTFWALGEMIRQRAGIAEGDDSSKARIRLRTMVAEFIPSEDDQRWVEPRLAALIGIAEMPPGERGELFAALRSFFQSIAERGTVLMVFEDMHWADDGLVDFVDELVERSTKHPILVLTLARPDLLDRRPDWGSSRKRMMSMHLGRLENEPMCELVAGLAPGLPDTMVMRIAERTAGVPLHAVEFIRMLVNGGQLTRTGDSYRFDGDEGTLAVPDSLSAIIGARLDRLAPGELELVQDASVLGYSFSVPALAAVRGVDASSLDAVVRDLIRSEVLEFDEDPRSPERGQYRFVQSLIREVAYGRLTKTAKVARHLSVAAQMESLNDPEVAGVIASHYANAAAADPSDPELTERARVALVGAAERASTLHSHRQAVALFDQAIELTADEPTALSLMVRATDAAVQAGLDNPHERALRAMTRYRELDDDVGECLAVTEVARYLSGDFRAAEAVDLILPVFEGTKTTTTTVWGRLASETARALMLADRPAEAIEVADRALPVITELGDDVEAMEVLINRGTALANTSRKVEGLVTLLGAAEYAKQHDLLDAQIRALNNVFASTTHDDNSGVWVDDHFHELLQRSGNQTWIVRGTFFTGISFTDHGRYDEALEVFDAIDDDDLTEFWVDQFAMARSATLDARDGPSAERSAAIEVLLEKYRTTTDPQLQQAIRDAESLHLFIRGQFVDVIRIGLESGTEFPRTMYPVALELAAASAALLRHEEELSRLSTQIDGIASGRVTDGLRGFVSTYRLILEGDLAAASREYAKADMTWEEVGSPYSHAVARAVVATIAGSRTDLGRGAAGQAYEFFSSAGAQGYLNLFAEAFEELAAGNTEGDIAV